MGDSLRRLKVTACDLRGAGDAKSPQALSLRALRSTKYKIRTYDPIRVKDVLYH